MCIVYAVIASIMSVMYSHLPSGPWKLRHAAVGTGRQ